MAKLQNVGFWYFGTGIFPSFLKNKQTNKHSIAVGVCRATLLWWCRQVRRSQRVQQGVEAGEEQQRQHRAQSHHVVELGLQRTAPILSHIRPIFRAVVG